MTATTRDEAQLLNRTVLASTIGALLAGGGAAQAQEPAAGQGQALEEITVTGSRIVRRDLEAASPIMTVDTQALEDTSTMSIESVLNQMPQFVPDNTQFDGGTNVASGAVTPGIASVNLRGIGANRTLVLIDGRRAQPVNASLIVDLNTIPSAAIERVETITGGASAVYGADALAGVVNFVLKDDFEGVEMDFSSAMTAEGDGNETRFTSLLGVNGEGGNGNVMLGVEWYKRDEVLQRDREFYRHGWEDQTNQTGGFLNATGFSPGQVTINTSNITLNQAVLPLNRPTQAAVDAVFAPYGIAPGTVSNSSEIYFQPDGRPFTLSGINYTGPIMRYENLGDGFAGVHRQPNGSLQQVNVDALLSTPSERRSLFGRATFDMNDNLTAFAQATYSNIEVTTRGGFPPAITVWQAPVPNDGLRTLPANLQQLLDSRTGSYDPDGPAGPQAPIPGAQLPWNLFRGIDFLGGPQAPTTSTDAYQLMVGIEGAFTNRDWTYDAYVSNGETDILIYYDDLPSLQRYQFLVAQPNWGVGSFVRGRNYDVTCSTGLPMFTLASTAPDAGCQEAIQSKLRPLQKLSQDIIEANLQGKIADMKSGELRFAAGVSNRRNEFRYEPGGTNDNISIIEQPIGIFVSNNTSGETEVSELYGELLVPVADRLDLELGYRYSDYDRAGGVDTWKSLINWSATDAVRIRGGFQVATRQANTEELFAGPRLNTVADFIYGDPCQVSTTAPWGNRPPSQYPATGATHGGRNDPSGPNPNYLQVQALCRALIDRADTNTANDGTSAFNTNTGSAQYPGTGPNAFTRPGLPFFQAENEIPRGNPDVNPEEAETWTLGVVFAGPGSFENLTASIDFYDIEITDVIATIDSTFVYSKCFNADGVSNPTYSLNDPGRYCDMIGRQVQTGERDTVQAPYVNSGMLFTRGVDLGINWTADLGDAGSSLYINSQITYLDEFKIQDAPGEIVLDVRDTLSTTYYGAQYKYKLYNTFGFNFPNGRASVALNWRHLPEIRSETAARNPATRQLGADSYDVFGLNTRVMINDRLEFRGGIDNLFDEDPVVVEARPGLNPGDPPIDSNTDVTRTEYYDALGRRAYIGLKMSF